MDTTQKCLVCNGKKEISSLGNIRKVCPSCDGSGKLSDKLTNIKMQSALAEAFNESSSNKKWKQKVKEIKKDARVS